MSWISTDLLINIVSCYLSYCRSYSDYDCRSVILVIFNISIGLTIIFLPVLIISVYRPKA